MFYIIASNSREYGPLSGAQVRQWFGEHRLVGETLLRLEGSESWQPLSTAPEFGDLFGGQSKPREVHTVGSATAPTQAQAVGKVGGSVAPSFVAGQEGSAAGLFSAEPADYDLEIGACISWGWGLFRDNVGTFLLAMVVYFGVLLGLSLTGRVPLVGAFASLASFVIGAPLVTGLYYLFLRASRDGDATLGHLFEGFRTRFGSVLLGQVCMAVVMLLCFIPTVLALLPWIAARSHNYVPPGGYGWVVCFVILGLLGCVWLAVNWTFALLLMVDRDIGMVEALRLSWCQVRRHWWLVAGLLFVCSLVNLAGACLCGVGLLASMPVAFGAKVKAYEIMFPKSPV